jgi:signal transduction histidine kinase
MAEGIRYAVGRSEQVIDGLLMLARTGIVESTTTAGLAELIDHALDEAAEGIAERDISVRKTEVSDAGIRCDPVLIERMLRNLFDNAAIHNEPGGWIEIESHAQGDEVVTRITNAGAVLDEKTVARLGEPFYRARAGQGDVPGTGLGLAIARSIAEAHGGRLDIDGRPGGGVIATVVLPAIEPDRSRATKREAR